MKNDTEIHIVDPYLNSTIRSSYKCLSAQPFFHNKTFDEFVTDNLSGLIESPNKSSKRDALTGAPS